MTRTHTIVHTAAQLASAFTSRPVRPSGMGYGRSSGYGTPRSYATASVPARFRIV